MTWTDAILSFHPALIRVKDIIDSGELGKLKRLRATLNVPWQITFLANKDDDIRFQLELGGGIMMDMGCKYLSI